MDVGTERSLGTAEGRPVRSAVPLRPLSVVDLFGLAAGGVIGSGWLLGARQAQDAAGFGALYAWLIGGAVMLVIVAVMVKLGSEAPKTGGLVFWPLQSSGPLVATVVAAGLWVFYAINPASEAAAMTQGLSPWIPSLYDGGHPTGAGIACAVGFMVVIGAVNFLAPHVFVRANVMLTAVKVLVPVLVVALLLASGFDAHGLTARRAASGAGVSLDSAMAAVTGAGVIYAYTGFQGPLDFSGHIRASGIGEAARLRWALYGTVVGSIVLYTGLQLVFAGHARGFEPGNPNSPYTQFASAVGMTWLAWLIRINALLSPAESGLVFAFELTREVEALSRAHLTHRGLQTHRRRHIRVGGRTYEVLWLVLLVDTFISVLILVLLGASWPSLTAISSVLTLVVYAMPAVALTALGKHYRRTGEPRFRLGLGYRLLARMSFIAVALVLYSAGFAILWKGMLALVVGATLLLALPVLARRDAWLVGRVLRMYDADAHVEELGNWRSDPSVKAALVLASYLAALTLLSLAGKSGVAFIGEPYGKILVCVLALVSFEAVVRASVTHMAETRPVLPMPRVSARRE